MFRPTARAFRGVAFSAAILGAATAPLSSQATRVSARPRMKISAALVLPDKTVRPLTSFALQLVPAGDSTQPIALSTDANGMVSIPVPPGSYQIRSVAPATLNDSTYRWSVPVIMPRGGTTIQISNANATVASTKRAAVTQVVSGGEVVNSAPASKPAAAPAPVPAAKPAAAPATASATAPAPKYTVAQSGEARDSAAMLPMMGRPLRHGMWLNVGFGGGSLGCSACSSTRFTGFSGGFGIGATITRHLQFGVQTAGFVKQQGGVTLNVSSANAVMRLYPRSEGRFFVLAGGGAGMAAYYGGTAGQGTATGGAGLLGMGYDVKLTQNVNLTPFWNAYVIAINGGTMNVGQAGLGLTVR